MSESKNVNQVLVRFSDEQFEYIKSIAEKQRDSKSSVVRQIVTREINKVKASQERSGWPDKRGEG